MNVRRFPFASTRRVHPKMRSKRPASTFREYNFFQTWRPTSILGQIEKHLDTVFKMFRLYFFAAISLGVILILVYCGRIEYFPSGLTIGDGFVFVGACLYFTTLYVFFTMFQFSAGLLIFFLLLLSLTPFAFIYLGFAKINKIRTRLSMKDFLSLVRFDVAPFSLLGLWWISYVAVPESIKDFNSGSGMIISIAVMTFLCCIWAGHKIKGCVKDALNNQSSTRVIIVCLTGIIFSPALISGYQGKLIDRAMTLMGVRSEDASVQLEESYAQLASQHGLDPLKIKGLKNYGYFPECKLLLMGIGANVVVEIKGVKLIVPSDKIIIGKGNKATNNDDKPREADHAPDRFLTLTSLQGLVPD